MINTLPFWFKNEFPKYSIKKEELNNLLKNISLYFDVVYDLNYKKTPTMEFINDNYPNILTCDWIDMLIEQAKFWFEMWSWWKKIDGDNMKHIFRNSLIK
jgi:shikimate 5-dehydrogenase